MFAATTFKLFSNRLMLVLHRPKAPFRKAFLCLMLHSCNTKAGRVEAACTKVIAEGSLDLSLNAHLMKILLSISNPPRRGGEEEARRH